MTSRSKTKMLIALGALVVTGSMSVPAWAELWAQRSGGAGSRSAAPATKTSQPLARVVIERADARATMERLRPIRREYLEALKWALHSTVDPSINAKGSMDFWLEQADGLAKKMGQPGVPPGIKAKIAKAYDRTELRRAEQALSTALAYASGARSPSILTKGEILSWFGYADQHHVNATGEHLPAAVKSQLSTLFEQSRPARVRSAEEAAGRFLAREGYTTFATMQSSMWSEEADKMKIEKLFDR